MPTEEIEPVVTTYHEPEPVCQASRPIDPDEDP